jgi:hypothetical protein
MKVTKDAKVIKTLPPRMLSVRAVDLTARLRRARLTATIENKNAS